MSTPCRSMREELPPSQPDTPMPERSSIRISPESIPESEGTSLFLPRLFMDGVAAQLLTILLELQPLSPPRLFRGAVVPLPRIAAFQPDVFTYHITTSGKKP